MIIDANQVPKNSLIEVDLCIVGGGAAGLAVAREFAGQARSVCLLESGGEGYAPGSQSLNEGDLGGFLRQPLNGVRMRGLGGTTAVWSGRSRPLDRADFEARDWVPESGWPFGREELDPYYARAQEVCQLGPYEYDVGFWEKATQTPRLPIEAGRVENALFQNSPPTHFGLVYKQEIEEASNIRCYLNATVTGFDYAETKRAVEAARVQTLEGNAFKVAARQFILALGGIENARFLLLADLEHPGQLGNGFDRVGRYFMDHPEQNPAYAVPEDSTIDGTFVTRNLKCSQPQAVLIGFLTLTDEQKKKEGLLNANVVLNRAHEPGAQKGDGLQSLRRLVESIKSGSMPENLGDHISLIVRDYGLVADGIYRRVTGENQRVFAAPPSRYLVNMGQETVPDPESRVTLVEARDALGQNRCKVTWKLNELDRRTCRRTLEIVAEEMGRIGFARMKIELDKDGPDWHASLKSGHHHMGTTRMNKDPKRGVVDANCRVHGVSNLYVAGSSVFPTSGHANPTLTIVALSLRLSDHLKDEVFS